MSAGSYHWRLAIVLSLGLALAGLSPAAAADDESSFKPRENDQIWLVSTRGVHCVDEPAWSACRYDAGYWKSAENESFYKSDDEKTTTVIYVHGNRVNSAGAEAQGLAIYRELVSGEAAGKVRYVIWSWPSDQIKGPIRDVRSKAARSDDEAYLLARFLAPIPKERQVGLIGFSYGARIIGGGLHILGGGDMLGRTVVSGDRPEFRVVYWAAAVQNDWLLPENVHGKAMPLGKSWLNIYTSCDSVLRHYDRVDRCDGSPAQGYVGLAGGKSCLPAELADRYEDLNVSHLIGSEHRSEPYYFTGEIIQRTRDAVLGN